MEHSNTTFESELYAQISNEVYIDIIEQMKKKSEWLNQREKNIELMEANLEEKIRQVEELKSELEKQKSDLDSKFNMLSLIEKSNTQLANIIVESNEKIIDTIKTTSYSQLKLNDNYWYSRAFYDTIVENNLHKIIWIINNQYYNHYNTRIHKSWITKEMKFILDIYFEIKENEDEDGYVTFFKK